MDLKTSVLNIAAEILAELQRIRIISLEELDELIQSRVNESARVNFVPALSLLYLMGRIDYDSDADVVIFTTSTGGNQ
jgi:hypothetical protein